MHPNLWDLWNLISLKYISYLDTVALLRFHSFTWKGHKFHRLKEGNSFIGLLGALAKILLVLQKAQWSNYFPDSFTQSVVDPFYNFFVFRKSIRSEIGTNIQYDIRLRIWQYNSLGVKFSETFKKTKTEGRTRAKETSLKFWTSATDFLPKNNKVHVIVHQGCFFTLASIIRGRHLFQS